MDGKQQHIAAVQKKIGPVYKKMKWFNERDAVVANAERNRRLQTISDKINVSFFGNKIHSGKLSPGCMICGQGGWSCMFINGLCSRNCFYCPQDRTMTKEREPDSEGIAFSLRGYMAYIKKFAVKGVAFSGGETFLVFDRLVEYIRAIKGKSKKSFYVWLYTNGDFIDKEKLTVLNKLGVDEIRINISANKYDLQCVKLATAYFHTVTVEIPVIPEDFNSVKRLLPKMEKIGVQYLNLHQLLATKFNYENYIKRNYTFLHYPRVLVYESELMALDILKFAVDNGIRLPINYCSSLYKDHFQNRGLQLRIGRVIKESYEELTSGGYIRSLSIQSDSRSISKIVGIMKQHTISNGLWKVNDMRTELFFHSSLFRYIIFHDNFVVRYYQSHFIADYEHAAEDQTRIIEIPLIEQEKVYVKKTCIFEQTKLSVSAANFFHDFFIKGVPEEKVIKKYLQTYDLLSNDSVKKMMDEKFVLGVFKKWEKIDRGFADIY